MELRPFLRLTDFFFTYFLCNYLHKVTKQNEERDFFCSLRNLHFLLFGILPNFCHIRHKERYLYDFVYIETMRRFFVVSLRFFYILTKDACHTFTQTPILNPYFNAKLFFFLQQNKVYRNIPTYIIYLQVVS